MKLWLLISLICGLIIANRSAVMRGTYKDPRYPGKCVVGDLILSPGERSINSAHCRRILCGQEGAVVFHTCGARLPPEGYNMEEPIEPTAPYPKCCEKHFIPINNNTE